MFLNEGDALMTKYFSKLSLSVQAKENIKMAELFSLVAARLCTLDFARERTEALRVLHDLEREAIVENGSWILNYAEQNPDIVL